MFITRVTTFSERFLSDRSFDLIVGPAIADFEYDAGSGRLEPYVAVLRAVVGAAYEDLSASSSAATFLGLAVIPAAYYAFFFVLCVPEGLRTVANHRTIGLLLALATGVASIVPVTVCFWPERPAPRRTPEA
jgi:hypothetical protein